VRTTVAAHFAAHALNTRFGDLSSQAIERAKTFLLDSLGVGIAGSTAEGADGLGRVVTGWGQGDVPVWGRSLRVGAPAAAFLNAWQIHNQEFDCLHEGAVVHVMAVVMPAALAAAATRGPVDGETLITAIAVGVDVAAGLGLASRAGFRFFRPGTAGGFGAVAAASRILGLDHPTAEAAFAWQLAQVSGTMQAHEEGSAILPAQVAFNARAALNACELAALGLTPVRAVFEGPYGYLPLFEGDTDIAPVLESLGKAWRIAEVSHKPFPSGRATHGGIEGVMALRAEHGFAVDDIDRIEVIAPPLIARLVGRVSRPDAGASYARLCMAFAIAKLLRNGAVDLSDFRGPALTDAETHALAARIQTTPDDNPDPNALAPQTVLVHLKSGATLRWHAETLLANPARPLTEAQHLAKFRRCLDFAAEPLRSDAADELILLSRRLETLRDVGVLAELAAPRTGGPA